MNNLDRIALTTQIASGLILISSFFTEDNKKAVNRRWVALGLFASGFVIKAISTEIKIKETKFTIRSLENLK